MKRLASLLLASALALTAAGCAGQNPGGFHPKRPAGKRVESGKSSVAYRGGTAHRYHRRH